MATVAPAAGGGSPGPSVVISFYRYLALGSAGATAAAEEQRRLGAALGLRGRVLVASEGINGTLQGTRAAIDEYEAIVDGSLGVQMDWKQSDAADAILFPDFVVKEVPELVSFGDRAAKLLERPLDVAGEGGLHLSPEDFDGKLKETPLEQLRIIDVRNSFEFEVGHFEGAIDPGMNQTAQWPRFVERNLEDLRGKQVLLYCTGGVRCEKASAYLNRRLVETSAGDGAAQVREAETQIFQLHGGIHRYLEAFPDGGQFKGANFVFDKREQQTGSSQVGTCSECGGTWGRHHGGRVCCVCRALVLVCDDCDGASAHGEYYCAEHESLRGDYFHFLDRFGSEELQRQSKSLHARLAQELGPRRKNRRNTLRRKLEQIEAQQALLAGHGCQDASQQPPPRRCRACERPYAECPGACWGFWKAVGEDGNGRAERVDGVDGAGADGGA